MLCWLLPEEPFSFRRTQLAPLVNTTPRRKRASGVVVSGVFPRVLATRPQRLHSFLWTWLVPPSLSLLTELLKSLTKEIVGRNRRSFNMDFFVNRKTPEGIEDLGQIGRKHARTRDKQDLEWKFNDSRNWPDNLY